MTQIHAVKQEAEKDIISFNLDQVDEITLDIEYILEVLQLLIQINDQATNPCAMPTAAITCEALERIVRIKTMFDGKGEGDK